MGCIRKWIALEPNFFGKELKKSLNTIWLNGKWYADQKTKGVWGLLTLGL
jgi:hypothetical protein